MTLTVLYDDVLSAPDTIQSLIGIDRFGKLIFKRRTLATIIADAAAEAGLARPIHLRTTEDWNSVEARLTVEPGREERFLLAPSWMASGTDGSLANFLRQARYAPGNLMVPCASRRDEAAWFVLSGSTLLDYVRRRREGELAGFVEAHRASFIRLEGKLPLIDLTDETALLEFLSTTFDVRYFNAIVREDFTVAKRSPDREKLRREFDFVALLPAEMRSFFVQPFDFRDEGAAASYRMERLFIPDMALQWLHGALSKNEFERFLDHLFYFIEVRAKRAASRGEAERVFEALYRTKLQERVETLKRLPEYDALEPLFARAFGGIDALAERYFRLLNGWRRHVKLDRLAIGHGDLCFSNILYGKTGRVLRLVDPRGASTEADLWTDTYYDVAKLSHSVQGDYDFINHDMFDITIDERLEPTLRIDKPKAPWARQMLVERLQRAGFDPKLVRLYEASLFLSMLPLHVDRPRKVLGFALTARAILGELEGDA